MRIVFLGFGEAAQAFCESLAGHNGAQLRTPVREGTAQPRKPTGHLGR